jgi:ribosomal protein L29
MKIKEYKTTIARIKTELRKREIENVKSKIRTGKYGP